MRCLIIYDIPNDRLRNKVADICLDYGLDRIQFSAFLGQLSRNHQEELMLKVEMRMEDNPGNIQLIPICAKDWAERMSYEVEAEEEEEEEEKEESQ
jgi:CRISPR-associated protein Cas2